MDREVLNAEEALRAYLEARVSRAQLLAAAGAGLAMAMVPKTTEADGSAPPGSPRVLSFPFFPQVQGTYTTESILDILNMLVTFEHGDVAFLADHLSRANELGLSSLQLAVEQASIAEHQYRTDFLESLGGRSLTDILTLRTVTRTAVDALRKAEFSPSFDVAAYMAAAREFAELGQPTLVKYAYQMGVAAAEERAVVRTILATAGVAPLMPGWPPEIPPNNKAFGTDYFLYVRDAYQFQVDLGFFGKNPVLLHYPGRDSALALAGPMAGGVLQKTPNNASVSTTGAKFGTWGGERGSAP